jgi:hypothetical protein
MALLLTKKEIIHEHMSKEVLGEVSPGKRVRP